MNIQNNYTSDTEPETKHRMLHIMLRVSDMQRSVDFYTRVMGMKVLRTIDQADDKYLLCFLGYDSEELSCALELTYNYGTTQYKMGNAYGHIAISVDNCHQACTDIRTRGGVILHPPFSLKGTNEIIAFISDPDDYQIELIQRN